MYRALFRCREKSLRIPFILGPASIEEIEKFLRGVRSDSSFRVCSASHTDIPSRKAAHEGSVISRSDHILHDFVHICFNGFCPPEQKILTFDLIDYLREATGFRWSRYIWELVDSEDKLLLEIQAVGRLDDFIDDFILTLFHFVKETQLWTNVFPSEAASFDTYHWNIISEIKKINETQPELPILQKLFQLLIGDRSDRFFFVVRVFHPNVTLSRYAANIHDILHASHRCNVYF